MILPVPVSLNRLAAPVCVFIFGMVAVVLLVGPPSVKRAALTLAVRALRGARTAPSVPRPRGKPLHVGRRRGRLAARAGNLLLLLRGCLCVAIGLRLGLGL